LIGNPNLYFINGDQCIGAVGILVDIELELPIPCTFYVDYRHIFKKPRACPGGVLLELQVFILIVAIVAFNNGSVV
jgi:hypothetical protein